MSPLPKKLQQAIKRGKLTPTQLRQLITLQAREIGLSYAEAVRRGRQRRLPRNVLGADLELLIQLLPA